jgi:leucyl aminopeptidase
MKVTSLPLAAAAGVALLSAQPATAWPLPQQLSFSDSPSLSTTLSLLSSLTSASLDVFTPRLVQTSQDEAPYWGFPHYLRWKGVRFFDVTDHIDSNGQDMLLAHSLLRTSEKKSSSFPSKLSYQHEVGKVHSNISQSGPRANIAAFTSFTNRYYKSGSGRQSQQWLLAKIKEIASVDDGITVEEFEHPWGQNSIIAKIPATDKEKAEQNGRIVVGSHQDSVNLL